MKAELGQPNGKVSCHQNPWTRSVPGRCLSAGGRAVKSASDRSVYALVFDNQSKPLVERVALLLGFGIHHIYLIGQDRTTGSDIEEALRLRGVHASFQFADLGCQNGIAAVADRISESERHIDGLIWCAQPNSAIQSSAGDHGVIPSLTTGLRQTVVSPYVFSGQIIDRYMAPYGRGRVVFIGPGLDFSGAGGAMRRNSILARIAIGGLQEVQRTLQAGADAAIHIGLIAPGFVCLSNHILRFSDDIASSMMSLDQIVSLTAKLASPAFATGRISAILTEIGLTR